MYVYCMLLYYLYLALLDISYQLWECDKIKWLCDNLGSCLEFMDSSLFLYSITFCSGYVVSYALFLLYGNVVMFRLLSLFNIIVMVPLKVSRYRLYSFRWICFILFCLFVIVASYMFIYRMEELHCRVAILHQHFYDSMDLWSRLFLALDDEAFCYGVTLSYAFFPFFGNVVVMSRLLSLFNMLTKVGFIFYVRKWLLLLSFSSL